MNVRRYRVVNVVGTGVLVLILVCLGLFWARWFCELGRHVVLAEAIDSPRIYPSHLFPGELGNEPNVASPSFVEGHLRVGEACALGLGLVQYVQNRLPEEPGSHVYSWDPDPDGVRVRFDRSLGLIVYRGTRKIRQSDGTQVKRKITLYAGPEGMAEKPGEKLRRSAGGDGVQSVLDSVRPQPAAFLRHRLVSEDRAARPAVRGRHCEPARADRPAGQEHALRMGESQRADDPGCQHPG